MAAEKEYGCVPRLDDILEKIERCFEDLLQRAPWDFLINLQLPEFGIGNKLDTLEMIHEGEEAAVNGASVVFPPLREKEITMGKATPLQNSAWVHLPQAMTRSHSADSTHYEDPLYQQKQTGSACCISTPKSPRKHNNLTSAVPGFGTFRSKKRYNWKNRGTVWFITPLNNTSCPTFENLYPQEAVSHHSDEGDFNNQHGMNYSRVFMRPD